jgi:hypothetical protein
MSSEMTERDVARPQARWQPVPRVLAAVGAILLLGITFVPWYRVGPGQVSRSAWQESPVVLVLLLAVVLAGGALALTTSRGRALAGRTLAAVFALTLATTLVVVFRLFIDRPGGNAATTLAFGGYPALLAINLVKTSAVLTTALDRRRRRAMLKAGGRNAERAVTDQATPPSR